MSGNSNQRTLFQTWGSSLSQSKVAEPRRDVKAAAGRSSSSIRARVAPGVPPHNPAPNPLWTEVGHRPTPGTSVRTEEDDDDDDLMLVAVYEAEKSLQSESGVRTTDPGLSPPPSGVQTYYPDFPGFDSSSAKVWIYPTNYPVREYQLKMSEAALFQNTLVCLPTGLGKTFIAAVVMYNFYRWYPCGKIVFMAPTKPLVAQQIEACYKVMGIPQSHMAELTGTVAAKNRQEVWRTKRVFFLTPQVMMNDLSRDTCPAQQVKCVVIDEAHKGLGNHAYCQVVRQLLSHTQQFRILALSATPGGDTKSVQSVISNLLISHIELRSEESPDIQAHSHQRSVEKVVVPLGDVLSAYQARYLQVLEKFMSRLVQYRVMAHKDLRTLCKYQLILARDQFRKNPPPSIKGYQLGMLEGDFALCISLYHGYELLMQMGLRSLFFYIQSIVDGSRENSRAKNELQRTPTFMDLYQEMEAMFVQSSAGPDDSFIYSHPKLEKLEEVVLQHFRRWKESSAENRGSSPEEVSTRVMIFSSFRESVQEIAVMLNRHAPLIRVMTFMGQASAGKGVKGFTQKEQLEVVHRFRQGGFNTLVSTCVGEEGLDIGEVDLIACFDAQKNPIRLVQRMGRTGRKRQGRIVVVLAEGKEERTYNQSQSNKRSVYKSITSNRNGFHMYQNSPRMIPDGVNPVLHKMHITCGQFDHGESGRRSSRGRRSHAEGRASLIHPHNLFQQSRATSDGFLSSTEYSLWASTMRLDEQEAQPTLKQSRFLSIPDALSPQEEVSKGQAPSRELSLWEWRLWQHKPLPTNAVDHSLRCSHFVQVMKLIDGMKEENEGECRYEQELLRYRNKDNSLTSGQKKLKATKIRLKSIKKNQLKPSHHSWTELLSIEEEKDQENAQIAKITSPSATTKDCTLAEDDFERTHQDMTTHLSPKDICTSLLNTDWQGIHDESAKRIKTKEYSVAEEDGELNAMFYLPKWDLASQSCPDKLLQEGSESVKLILANVEELLSRSPPPLADILDMDEAVLASPRPHHQLFPVSFDLCDEDDDDEAEMIVDPVGPNSHEKSHKVSSDCANSPTWDEVFDEEEEVDAIREINNKERITHETDEHITIKRPNDCITKENNNSSENIKVEEPEKQLSPVCMDESIDLFGDDEVFLQMTIPDVPTPSSSPNAKVKDDITLHRHNNTDSHSTAEPEFRTHRSNTSQDKEVACARNTTSNADSTDYSSKAKPDLHIKTVMHQSEIDKRLKGPSRSSDASHDLFSVNFDLGYLLEDSEEEEKEEEEAEVEEVPAKVLTVSALDKEEDISSLFLPVATNSSTPCIGLPRPRIPRPASGTVPSDCGVSLPSPITTAGVKRALMTRHDRHACTSFEGRQSESGSSTGRGETIEVKDSPCPTECKSDSEDEVRHKRRHWNKNNLLSSPEVSKLTSDLDSPVAVSRKRTTALNTSEETEAEADSDDDFQNESTFTRRRRTHRGEQQQTAQAKTVCGKGREFLDEEAVLSEDEDGADVSSDEEEKEEHERFLKGFVVDNNTHLSQGLNDSEMHGVYLKSVRSPAGHGKYKMSYRNHHRMDVFSQVLELDETYAEDSFVVGSDEEEPNISETEPEAVELMPEASDADGRKQYATRRRVFLHRVRTNARTNDRAGAEREPQQKAAVKRSRIIHIHDSSEDETEGSGKEKRLAQQQEAASSASSKLCLITEAQIHTRREVQINERCRYALENQHSLSNELDFAESDKCLSSKKPPQEIPTTSSASVSESSSSSSSTVCILVDSRCLSSAVDLMTSLRQRHGASVHVCSLDGSYFIVSSRMAVERHSQAALAAAQNRKRLSERVSALQASFDRVCLIVERERNKTGGASRPFQPTRFYDSTVAALVSAGVRLLWSDGEEQSAALLVELARLEQRKGQGIAVPLQVKGQHRQQALQLYLSLPSINYIQALNMSHNFLSVAQLINSSVEEIQQRGRMSRSRAEEMYRFLRYSCDSFLISTPKAAKTS
ncbi:Fanconi anemia group M protein isoform X1 [Gouania willdenowi]|uniref:Fanconi anemia group M protein n=1 Tax=Gouania willdenowi TaxID=441366 RepID=A0A8C5GIQ5_GOUWI|nr:Fanconi anemia group M protein isoform X1 [Gouania willdenowi]